MSSAVQFYGIDNVVKAFEYKKISTWAIFQGRQLLHKCEGAAMEESADMLQEYLEMIEAGGTGATYMLKVYECSEDQKKINEKTACDGSFNFRLISEETRQQRSDNYSRGQQEILDRLEAIEEEKNKEPEGFGEKIGAMLLADPTKLPLIISSLQSVIQLLLPTKKPLQPQQQMQPVYVQQPPPQLQQIQPAPVNDYGYPAAISGIEEPDELNKAIETLKKNDPKISEHLTKLAKMSEDNKETFTYLLSILDSM